MMSCLPGVPLVPICCSSVIVPQSRFVHVQTFPISSGFRPFRFQVKRTLATNFHYQEARQDFSPFPSHPTNRYSPIETTLSSGFS